MLNDLYKFEERDKFVLVEHNDYTTPENQFSYLGSYDSAEEANAEIDTFAEVAGVDYIVLEPSSYYEGSSSENKSMFDLDEVINQVIADIEQTGEEISNQVEGGKN